jgi:O-succinylbenzoate synthase
MINSARVYQIPMRVRFRGLDVRQGMLFRGPAGWAEWSPFLEYPASEASAWWDCAVEAATRAYPPALRAWVPVNVTVPAVGPDAAFHTARTSGCGTAKVKVAEPGQPFSADLERVEAVRAALGPSGRVRVDANGRWSVSEAESCLRQLHRFDLEYAEQPCATVDELAELRMRFARTGFNLRIAADESIRRAADPLEVRRRGAADVAVIKVQPLGGVRRALELVEKLGMPVVVSSALETSVGIRAGVALAAALPDLPFACGLNTVPLLAGDVTPRPLVAVNGQLPVRDVVVDPVLLDRWQAPREVTAAWEHRRATVVPPPASPATPPRV